MARYTEIELIEYIHKACKLLGRPPSKNEMGELIGFPSRSVYHQRFGSWKKALTLAGISCDHFLPNGGIESGKKTDWGKVKKNSKIILITDIRTKKIKKVRKKSRTARLRLRFNILERDNFTCRYCGRNVINDNVKLAIDHIVPFSKGGELIESNLITSCFDCNLGKYDVLLNISNEDTLKLSLLKRSKVSGITL